MESVNIRELNERIQKESSFVDLLTLEMGKVIVGQKHLVDNLLIGLLSGGHILLEGVPGLAKTLAINTLSKAVDAKFSRIQFTPDLLPADVVSTKAPSSPTLSWPMKSTVPRPKCKAPCWKPCRSTRLPLAKTPSNCRSRSW